MNIRMKKGSNNQEKRRAKLGVCFVEKRSTQKVMEEHRMKKGVKSRQSSADGDCGVPILADEHQMGGGGKECRIQYVSDNPDRGVPVGNEELLCLAEERGTGESECGMKWNSVHLG